MRASSLDRVCNLFYTYTTDFPQANVRSRPAITDPEINPKPAINEVVTMSKIDLNSETTCCRKSRLWRCRRMNGSICNSPLSRVQCHRQTLHPCSSPYLIARRRLAWSASIPRQSFVWRGGVRSTAYASASSGGSGYLICSDMSTLTAVARMPLNP